MLLHIGRAAILAGAVTFALVSFAGAVEIKILTAGAFKEVLLALVPDFEKQSGHKLVVDNDTVGALKKRIQSGEAFDVAVLTPAAIGDLTGEGKIDAASKANLATVGVGIVVKQGAPKPDVSTVEAFKRALLAAKSVAYIDPASGGSSGIYIDKMLERLGIADQIRPKAKLKKGGHVADLIVSGEAELGLHQISEIVQVKGAVLVGPLPKEIQNTTTYTAGVSSGTKDRAAAQSLVKMLSGPAAAAVLKSKGMDPAG